MGWKNLYTNLNESLSDKQLKTMCDSIYYDIYYQEAMPWEYELGIIYFISDGNKIKIGKTLAPNIYQRITQLQTGNPNRLILLGYIMVTDGYEYLNAVESLLHKRYKRFQKKGEWFDLPDNIFDVDNCLKDFDLITTDKFLEYETEFYINGDSTHNEIKYYYEESEEIHIFNNRRKKN